MAASPLTDSLRETLAVFEGPDAGTPLTTNEVAERLDLGRRSSYDRLDRLVERDRLETKKVGARGRVWWRPPADPPTVVTAEGERRAEEPTENGPTAPDAAPRDGGDAPIPIGAVLDSADVGVFVLDADFDVVWIDAAVERYFGLDREAVVGRDKRALVRDRICDVVADPESFAETVLAAYDDNAGPERFECRVTADEGREARWLEHRSRPIESGPYAGGRVEVYYDVTDRKRAEEALLTERERFESLVGAVEEYAIFMLDPDGRVRTWNPGAARIKGYDREAAVGEHVSTFYTEADREAGVPRENLAAAEERGAVEYEGWRVRADGSRFWARVTITAISDDGGDLEGFAKVTRDLTDRREHERALRRERDLLERVLETSPIGIGVFDEHGDAMRVNRRFADLLGRSGSDPGGYSLGDQPIVDEDGEVIPYRERPAAVALATGERVTDERIRVAGPDGKRRWLSVNAEPVGGDVEGVVVTTADVTRLEERTRQLERQRDEVKAELQEVFDRVDDALWGLDDELRFTYVNDRASELLDRSEAELVGTPVREALPWLEDLLAPEKFEEAMSSGRTVRYEDHVESTDRWYEVRLYPDESGLSVYYQDVTERKTREEALAESQRLNRALLDNFPNGAVALFDEELRHLVVGGTLFDELGVTTEEMEGRRLGETHPPAVADQIEPEFRAVFDGEAREFEVEHGDSVRTFRAIPVRDEDGAVTAGLAVSQDVTERRLRERELERYETIVETVDDGIYALDEEGTFVLVNDAYCDIVGRDREELVGRDATVVHDDEVGRRSSRLAAEVAAGERELATVELDLEVDGETIPLETRLAPYRVGDGDGHGRCGVVRDVSERVERERELERYVGIVDAVGEAVYELDEQGRFTFVNDAMVERSGYSESELLGEHASIGMDAEAVARAESAIAELVADDDAVRTTLEYDVVTKDGDRTPVENRLSVRTDGDGRFRGSAGLLWDVSERVERERALERQRDRLRALDDLNGVVREITDAVIEQPTREEIERIVCERLAATDSYSFAWIGDVDGHAGEVVLREEAGVDGYLDDITITVDPDDERSAGPTGRALLEREIQVTQDVQAESDHDPWREEIREYGFRSSAAIPIVHEGTRFGVLNVYADRPKAFSEDEQAVIGQLGEVVGHAIAAVERKQALMSDEVVEVEFQVQDAFAAVDLADGRDPASVDGSITLDRSVPIGGGSYLVYGTATDDAMAVVRALVESDVVPHWGSATVLRRPDGATGFELRMDQPPVLTAAANHGGSVREATVEGGDLHVRVSLAPSADVRQVADAVDRSYPGVVMVTRQQVTRPRRAGPEADGSPLETLTDRQRTAVESAYYSGYYEWPRDSNGEDVAASIGIDPSTFNRHLREAQRKVIGTVLDGDPRTRSGPPGTT